MAVEPSTFNGVQEIKLNGVKEIKSKASNELQSALAAARTRFEAAHPNSKKQHGIAVQSLPGGNTRSLLHTSPFPLCMKSGKGPYVFDEDNHK
jgi:glutamate-1-semialdehyde 2,1-aminomutase